MHFYTPEVVFRLIVDVFLYLFWFLVVVVHRHELKKEQMEFVVFGVDVQVAHDFVIQMFHYVLLFLLLPLMWEERESMEFDVDGDLTLVRCWGVYVFHHYVQKPTLQPHGTHKRFL